MTSDGVSAVGSPEVKRGFGSDNHSGVHPRIMSALARANVGHAPSYGTDALSIEADAMMKRHFGSSAQTYFVFNGTAANVLALAACVKSHHIIFAAESSHIANDEGGAPEKILGAKVRLIATEDGKITPEKIAPFLIRRGDQHASQPRVISITQPTEVGTLYTVEELRSLGAFAKRERLLFHVDGARLVNAAAALGVSFREMTTDCGVDVVSFGGTKNGLMFGEAIVFINEALSQDFKHVRKQLMQLPSKTRFVAAQFLEFLGTDLWLTNAEHANAMAQRLSEGLSRSRFAQIAQATQANGVFVRLPRKLVSKLREAYFFYVMNEHTFEARLMCTWDTELSDIEGFLRRLEDLGESFPELAKFD